MNTQILLMNEQQINLLLTHHEYFSPEEIQLAAKMKVHQQKEFHKRMKREREINKNYMELFLKDVV